MENKVTLIGRIVSDIEASATRNTGTPVAKFRVAEEYYDRGTKSKKTNFFNCVAFGHVAENICAYFFKGKRIAVYGHLVMETYEKDDQKKLSVNLTVAEWDFADGKKEQTAKPESVAELDPETAEA